MSDIVERLRDYAKDDHERGCSGRYYDCHCGYDGKRDQLIDEAADRIERLEAELTIQYQDGHHDGYEKGCTISKEVSERYDRIDARIEQLEAALREIGTPPDHFTINDAVAVARAALGEERT